MNHGQNLLFTTTAGVPINASFAFIDYGYAMTHSWRAPKGYQQPFVAPMYDSSLTAEIPVLQEAIALIEGIADATINHIVGRIPDAYLSAQDKALISQGLLYRRDNLKAMIATRYPGVK